MQLTTGLLLSFSLSTSVLPLIPLTMLFFSIVLLRGLGIMDSSNNLLKSYLSNRSFSVTSGSTPSSILSSSCGVPQGSVSDPISFHNQCLTIASSVSSHGVNQQLYADDAQLFSSFPLHLLLAVFAVFSVVFLPSQLVPPQWSSSGSN